MIAILGAGISGLTSAYYLQKAGEEVVILEEGAFAGGKIKSFNEQGFVGELGPNTVLLNNQVIIELLKELSLYGDLIFADPKNISKRFVLYKGRAEAIPTGIVTALKSPLLGFSTFGKLLSDLQMKVGNPAKESLANLVRRHFGQEAYENFVVPMLTGIYAGDPEKMDADLVLPFLKKADREKGSIIKGMLSQKKAKAGEKLPKQKIFTFEKGLQQLPMKLAKTLEGRLQLNAKVTAVHKKENGYSIEFRRNGDQEIIHASKIISTLPTPALSKIKSNFLGSNSENLKKIPYVPIVVLHFAYAKNDIGFQKKAFGLLSRPAENVPFLGILFNSRFFPHTAPENTELLTVICGGGLSPEIAKMEDHLIFKQVEHSLKKILSISGQPIFKKLSRWYNAIPQYHLGHEEINNRIEAFEEEHQGFFFAGNYLQGISVSDCIKNAKNLVSKIEKED